MQLKHRAHISSVFFSVLGSLRGRAVLLCRLRGPAGCRLDPLGLTSGGRQGARTWGGQAAQRSAVLTTTLRQAAGSWLDPILCDFACSVCPS